MMCNTVIRPETKDHLITYMSGVLEGEGDESVGETRRKQGATQMLHANITSPEFMEPFPTDSNREKEIPMGIGTLRR